MKRILAAAIAVCGFSFGAALANDAQETFDKNMENAKEVHKQMEADRQREQMRDKSHDSPRVKVGKDRSIGIDPQKKEINIKETF